MTNTQGQKVTRATIESFIVREMSRDNLYISNKSNFDGMVDCVMPVENKGFRKANQSQNNVDNTLGVSGAWFVGSSRDYFSPYADENFIGYEVYNCCGSFVLAMHR